MLVDGGARPDLVGRIIRDNLQEVTCPSCSQIHRLELPVLVFRQETSPTLVFSPSRAMNDSENSSRQEQLIRILKTQIETFELRAGPDGERNAPLGYKWQASWADSIAIVGRAELGLYLSQALELEKLALIDRRERGDVRPAVDVARSIVEMTRGYFGSDDLEYATALNNLGVVLDEAGLFADAASAHREALSIRTAIDDHSPEAAQSLDNLAQALLASGEMEASIAFAKRSLDIRQKIFGPNHLEVATSLNSLANIYIRNQNFVEAETALKECLDIRERELGLDHPDVAVTLNNQGALFRRTKRFAEASKSYNRSLGILSRMLPASHPYLAGLRNNLAILQTELHNVVAAGDYARVAAAATRSAFGETNAYVAKALLSQAGSDMLAGRFDEAETAAKEALAIAHSAYGELHNDVINAINMLSVVYNASGRHEEAIIALEKALALALKVFGPDHIQTGTIYRNLGCTSFDLGDKVAALSALRKADDILDKSLRHVLSISDEPQRMLHLVDARSQMCIHLSVLIATEALDRWISSEPMRLVLRRKLIGLDYAYVHLHSLNARSGDYKQARWRELQLAIAQMQVAGTPKDAQTTEPLAAMMAEFAQLDREIIYEIPSEAWANLIANVNVEDIQNALGARSALIEFVQYERYVPRTAGSKGARAASPMCYLAFVVKPGMPGVVWAADLGEVSAINTLIERYRTVLQGGDGLIANELPLVTNATVRAEVTLGARLRRLIFGPLLEPLEGIDDLIVAADGALSKIPFSVLPDEEGKRLGSTCGISYVGCGRDLIRGVDPEVTRAVPLVVADPDYDYGLFSEGQSSKPVDKLFTPLPGTREEGQAIAEMLGVNALFGVAARKETVLSQKHPWILHLATHGFYFEMTKPDAFDHRVRAAHDRSIETASDRLAGLSNPLLRSGVALTGANVGLSDDTRSGSGGLLTAAEVMALDLRGTEMVVLSACETGLGDSFFGEGTFGLQRSFLLAGAKSVVVSLWPVPDSETCDLMREFYRLLLIGTSRVEALRRAQDTVRARQPHPAFWGGFILQGERSPLQHLVAS
ncbi:CHAT domain-containing protein [Mesorhizobium sp. M0816]